MTECVIVLTKYPLPGQVKTRLVKQIGATGAAELYRAFVKDLLEKITDANLPLQVHFTPTECRQYLEEWLGTNYEYYPQVDGDLGHRMKTAFSECFLYGTDRIILVGADLPDLPARILRQALEKLEEHDIVLGPAADGGYYLIGFRKEGFAPEIFDDIEWSSDRVLMDTIAKIHLLNKTAVTLCQWKDVDTPADLEDLIMRCDGDYGDCPNTGQWLRENFPRNK